MFAPVTDLEGPAVETTVLASVGGGEIVSRLGGENELALCVSDAETVGCGDCVCWV